MKTLHIEIRAAEGGDDAKLLINEQASIYENVCKLHKMKWTVKKVLPG